MSDTIGCRACDGSGYRIGSRASLCETCDGTGLIQVEDHPASDPARLATMLQEWGLEVRKIGVANAEGGAAAVALLARALGEMRA